MKPPKGLAAIYKTFGDPGKPGSPNRDWEEANLVWINTPYAMYYAGRPVTRIRVHRKLADHFTRAMCAVLEWAVSETTDQDRIAIKHRYGFDHDTEFYDRKVGAAYLHAHHLDQYGGTVSLRPKRSSGQELSTHAWGIAVDVDPQHNGQGHTPTLPAGFVKCWTDQGFEWAGTWHRPDGMHFQWCTGY